MSHPLRRSVPPFGTAMASSVAVATSTIVGHLSWKQGSSVATTGDVDLILDLFIPGATIDGVSLVEGDRVLVWQNTDASENGVYVVSSTGAFRAADFDSSDEIVGALVPVTSGTTYGGSLFRNTNTSAVVVDTDDITFELYVSPGGAAGTAIPFDHGNLGSTETFDLADGTWHRGTLDDDCTVTVQGFTVDQANEMVLELTQDGTGGWGITWDPDIVFVGNDQPAQAAGDVSFFLLWTSQGDSLIYGAIIGAGGLTIKDEGVALATLAESLDFVGAGVTASGTGAAKTVTISGAPQGAAGGDLSGTYPNPTINPSAVAASIDSLHAHINDVLFSGDGSTTAFSLPVAPVDAYSVQAFVSGVLTEVTLSGGTLQTATFGSAPASATNNVRFDIVAAID